MKAKKYHALCIISYACLLILSGCIEEYEAELPVKDTDLLVVEGTICSSAENTFVLSRTRPITSANAYAAPLTVTGASVSVRGSDGSEYKAKASYGGAYGYDYDSYGDGTYNCWVDRLNPDVEYYLHIEVDGEVYESTPQKPLRSEKIADVRGVEGTLGGEIEILVTPESPLEAGKVNYYTWTYEETWEVRPDYVTEIYFDTKKNTKVDTVNLFPDRGWKDAQGPAIMVGASNNYEGQQIRDLKLYGIRRHEERMYYRYSGLVHQRAISKAEYEYELARRQASSEMGGLFTPQPSSLPTNIHCLTSDKRVIGYVGCALNTSNYRFFLNASDFSHYTPVKSPYILLEDCTEDDCQRMASRGMYLVMWDDKREDIFSVDGGMLQTAWVSVTQLDVRYRGAYIKEPEFWSWNENVSY